MRTYGFWLCCALTLSLSYAATPAQAQESPAQWLARIFYPSELGLPEFPEATLNRKLSVDAIQLEHGGTKRISISLIPPDALDRAAEFYQKKLEVAPQVTGEKTQWLTYTFDFTGDKGPANLKGLKMTITRSPFVDNRGQITMEYSPPPKPS